MGCEIYLYYESRPIINIFENDGKSMVTNNWVLDSTLNTLIVRNIKDVELNDITKNCLNYDLNPFLVELRRNSTFFDKNLCWKILDCKSTIQGLPTDSNPLIKLNLYTFGGENVSSCFCKELENLIEEVQLSGEDNQILYKVKANLIRLNNEGPSMYDCDTISIIQQVVDDYLNKTDNNTYFNLMLGEILYDEHNVLSKLNYLTVDTEQLNDITSEISNVPSNENYFNFLYKKKLNSLLYAELNMFPLDIIRLISDYSPLEWESRIVWSYF